MNIGNAKKWAAALRSGEYTQCRGIMATGDGSLCCLGVAAKVAGFTVRSEAPYSYVANWLGLIYNPMNPAPGNDGEYVALNDLEKKSFSEIADVVDERIAAQERTE